MSDRDYYEILGLTPRADGAMVDQAYWHLARKYQQLAGTNPRAQYMLDELNEAYGVLGNPRLREQYDAFRDDVLIRKGMVKPVKAKPHAAARRAGTGADGPGMSLPTLPRLSIANLKMYGLAAVVTVLAMAGAWQGVHVGIVLAGLAAGLGLALTPTVRDRLAQFRLSMPSVSMPSVSMPQMPQMPQMPSLQVPKVDVPDIEVPSLAGGPEGIDADELRRSTAETIARWRASVGLKAIHRDDSGGAPSTELVDIVEGERRLDADDEPINAVLDILRGAHRKSGAGTS